MPSQLPQLAVLKCLEERSMNLDDLLNCVKRFTDAYRTRKELWLDLQLMHRLGLVTYNYDGWGWRLTEKGRRELARVKRSGGL